MRKKYLLLVMTIVIGMVITACGNKNNENNTAYEPSMTTKEMTDSVTAKFEQPALMELPAENVGTLYHLDTALLEEYSILIPMMNIKTNEIAVLKVKDIKDVPAVETAVKQRAADVQKQFETYLPDQYENAKNYKLITKGKYVIFLISEKADDLAQAFENLFVKE